MESLNQREDWFPVDEEFLTFSVVSGGFCDNLSPLKPTKTTPSRYGAQNISVHEPEEDLEWISNKNAFPAIETCFGILAENPELVLKSKSNHHSPVSVLENSGISSNSNNTNINGGTSCCDSVKVPKYPVRPRSKNRRPRKNFRFLWLSILETVKKNQESSFSSPPLEKKMTSGAGMERRCLHCQVDKTPQWRTGPMGPKTLCNACGVRYKSGRLVPEYRPANSPTFSSALHSNSHRKVVEMRKRKQLETGGAGIVVNDAFGNFVK